MADTDTQQPPATTERTAAVRYFDFSFGLFLFHLGDLKSRSLLSIFVCR